MIYYCKHKREKIVGGKVVAYCLKHNCWALMMFSNNQKLARFINKRNTCKSLKKGL